MEANSNWNKWQPEDDALQHLLHTGSWQSLKSQHPLLKLRRNLLKGIAAAIIISAAYIVVLFSTNQWPVQLSLFILLLFNGYLIYLSQQLRRQVPTSIQPGIGLKQELQQQHNNFVRWQKVQEKLAIFVYPIAAAGGFILGGTLGSDKSFEALLARPFFLVALIITVAILTPISLLLARWMFKVAYGKHLNILKQLIDELGENGDKK
jgi:ABC-type sugar transport system permease subunit